MNEPSITLGDIGTLAALADGIIPADERDAGAGLVHAGPSIAERMRRSPSAQVYVEGLQAARVFASERFGQDVRELDANQMRELLAALRDQSPASSANCVRMCARFISAMRACGNASAFPGLRRRAAAIRTSINPRRQHDENACPNYCRPCGRFSPSRRRC